MRLASLEQRATLLGREAGRVGKSGEASWSSDSAGDAGDQGGAEYRSCRCEALGVGEGLCLSDGLESREGICGRSCRDSGQGRRRGCREESRRCRCDGRDRVDL